MIIIGVGDGHVLPDIQRRPAGARQHAAIAEDSIDIDAVHACVDLGDRKIRGRVAGNGAAVALHELSRAHVGAAVGGEEAPGHRVIAVGKRSKGSGFADAQGQTVGVLVNEYAASILCKIVGIRTRIGVVPAFKDGIAVDKAFKRHGVRGLEPVKAGL